MRPVASLAIELDCALRQFAAASGTGSARRTERARRTVLAQADALRAAACRLAAAEAASGLDASPEGARAALRTILSDLRRSGGLDWADVAAICNDVADAAPARPAGR